MITHVPTGALIGIALLLARFEAPQAATAWPKDDVVRLSIQHAGNAKDGSAIRYAVYWRCDKKVADQTKECLPLLRKTLKEAGLQIRDITIAEVPGTLRDPMRHWVCTCELRNGLTPKMVIVEKIEVTHERLRIKFSEVLNGDAAAEIALEALELVEMAGFKIRIADSPDDEKTYRELDLRHWPR